MGFINNCFKVYIYCFERKIYLKSLPLEIVQIQGKSERNLELLKWEVMADAT